MNRINLGARTYNPTTGRMDGVDAFADIMRRHSPYQANFNNPLRFIDPDGNEAQDFTYNDGYGTMSSRNSSGSVGFSGSYQNNDNSSMGGDPPSWVQKLFNFFGFFKQPESAEEAQTYAERQEQLSGISEQWQQAEEKLIDKTEYVPLVGAAAKLSKAMVEKDNTTVVGSTIMFALDATGGGGALPAITKAVNSNIAHAVERGVERAVFANKKEASTILKSLTEQISKNGFPAGSIKDPSYLDRVLVPIGNGGMAAYQVAKNGTAALKTILIAK